MTSENVCVYVTMLKNVTIQLSMSGYNGSAAAKL